MKVTPLKKKFGKYAPGDEFELPAKAARVLIKVGKLAAVEDKPAPVAAPTYQTRMLQAAPVTTAVAEPAPYGYKADGTPRKRPAPTRKQASE